jgi:hypothetical protein
MRIACCSIIRVAMTLVALVPVSIGRPNAAPPIPPPTKLIRNSSVIRVWCFGTL